MIGATKQRKGVLACEQLYSKTHVSSSVHQALCRSRIKQRRHKALAKLGMSSHAVRYSKERKKSNKIRLTLKHTCMHHAVAFWWDCPSPASNIGAASAFEVSPFCCSGVSTLGCGARRWTRIMAMPM